MKGRILRERQCRVLMGSVVRDAVRGRYQVRGTVLGRLTSAWARGWLQPVDMRLQCGRAVARPR